MVGFFGTTVDLALYNSGLSLMTILSTVGAGVGIITFPLFSKFYSGGRVDMIRAKTAEAERFISMMILPLVTVVVSRFHSPRRRFCWAVTLSAAGGPLQIVVITTSLGLSTRHTLANSSAINRNDLYLKITIFSLS